MEPETRDLQCKNILVVDDEPLIGIAFERELGVEGYHVDSVLSAEAALQAVREKHYDLAFIDKILPKIDGVTACLWIKKFSPGTICIFMTGVFDIYNELEEVAFVYAGGTTYGLYKPFVRHQLLDVIQRAIEDERGKQDKGSRKDALGQEVTG